MRMQGEAPVTCVFPVDGPLHLLEIRLQAIQLSPISRGVPRCIAPLRLDRPSIYCHAAVPLCLSTPGEASGPGTYLRIPPGYTGNTTGRRVAHHAIVPFRFPVQVSHQAQEPPFESLPAEPGNTTGRLVVQSRHVRTSAAGTRDGRCGIPAVAAVTADRGLGDHRAQSARGAGRINLFVAWAGRPGRRSGDVRGGVRPVTRPVGYGTGPRRTRPEIGPALSSHNCALS
jgi:hypothetical protein